MAKMFNKRYDKYERLNGYETETHIASLHIYDNREEWHQFNKETGEMEKLEYDLATGEKHWVKQAAGIIIEHGKEESILVDVKLTVEKYKTDENPLDKILKIKETL